MKFLRSVKEYPIINKIRKEDIRKELKIIKFWLKKKITELNVKNTWNEWTEIALQKQTCSTSPKGKETEEGCEKDGLRPEQAHSLQP